MRLCSWCPRPGGDRCFCALDDAIDEARSLAKIAADEKLETLLLPEPRGLFDELFSVTGGSGDPVVSLVLSRAAGVPVLEEAIRGTQRLRQVLSGRPQLLPPARITIR